MPVPRVNIRKIKDVLRLKLDAQLSHRRIAAALGLSKATVTKYVGLAAAAGLDWESVQSTDEATLERRLLAAPEQPRDHIQPEYGRLHHELRRKGMTLILLWEEHRTHYADGHTYSYSPVLRAGRRAAAICSLFATAKLNGLDPARWLADTLENSPPAPTGGSTHCYRS